MSDESDEPPVNPEYHLNYDTVDMTEEEYDRLRVAPVPVPVTPAFNIHRIIRDVPGLTREERWQRIIEALKVVPAEQVAALQHKWEFWARENQMPPIGFWTFWLLLAGRGFGKTRTGAEWVNKQVELGRAKRIALVAPTAADVRKVMVEGESGIIAKAPPWNRPHFEPSKLQLTWPNGAVAQMFSAEEPERLRGPQCDTFWADELCAWKKLQETWDMLMFGFRLGRNPQGCITTTPKPVPLLKELVEQEKTGTTKVVRGSTYENRGNLAKPFFDKIVTKYEGTRLGRQELEAAILEDMPGALWQRTDIERKRVKVDVPLITRILSTEKDADADPDIIQLDDTIDNFKARAKTLIDACGEDLSRVSVNVDPATSNNEGSDEIGITVTAKGLSGRGYLLADLTLKGTPFEWGATCVLAYDMFVGDRIIGEANQGGLMVEYTIASAAKALRQQGLRQTDFVPVTLVHATKGKVTRAEPVSALYEQGRVSHIGTHRILEDQMCLFTSDFDRKSMGYSPDRVDSLVWGLTHLFLEAGDTGVLEFYQQEAMRQAEVERKKGLPPEPSEMVKLKAPEGIGQAYGADGTVYSVSSEGCIDVPAEEAPAFLRVGFVEA